MKQKTHLLTTILIATAIFTTGCGSEISNTTPLKDAVIEETNTELSSVQQESDNLVGYAVENTTVPTKQLQVMSVTDETDHGERATAEKEESGRTKVIQINRINTTPESGYYCFIETTDGEKYAVAYPYQYIVQQGDNGDQKIIGFDHILTPNSPAQWLWQTDCIHRLHPKLLFEVEINDYPQRLTELEKKNFPYDELIGVKYIVGVNGTADEESGRKKDLSEYQDELAKYMVSEVS